VLEPLYRGLKQAVAPAIVVASLVGVFSVVAEPLEEVLRDGDGACLQLGTPQG